VRAGDGYQKCGSYEGEAGVRGKIGGSRQKKNTAYLPRSNGHPFRENKPTRKKTNEGRGKRERGTSE